MNCDQCGRRESRLKIAARQIQWDLNKFANDPSPGTLFFVEAAFRYVEEIISSHPEHRLKGRADIEARSKFLRSVVLSLVAKRA